MENVNSSATTSDEQVSPVRSHSPCGSPEDQQTTTEDLSSTSCPLPAFEQALDDYTWGDRPAESVTPLMEAGYLEVMHWKLNLFVPPSGNTANDVITEMTRLLLSFVERSGLERVALTAFFLLLHLVLQLPAFRRAAAKRKAIIRHLEMWQSARTSFTY